MAAEYFIWITVFAMLLYLMLLLLLTWGWYRIKHFHEHVVKPQFMTSIVVAVRNEAENIDGLLQALADQNYSKNFYELILVDDHSEDKTVELISRFIGSHPSLQIELIHAKEKGKKSALAEGIHFAIGELIVTTDGDCLMGADWLITIAAYYHKFDAKLIVAPVVYENEKGFLQRFFSLDFASLVASGAGSLGVGLPLMGNGANLAFSKKAWLEVKPENPTEAFASGDDVFLIHRIAKIYGRKTIHFLKSTSSIVRTNPPADMGEFFQQRIRWASKAKGYRSAWAIFVSLVVLATNLLIALTFFAGIFRAWFFVLYLLFVILKLLIDLPLLSEYTSFVNKIKLLLWSFPLALIYPLYIVVAAIPALFFRFEWKGRKGLQ